VIGIDTNILVRHLTQNDPMQSRRATHLIERELTQDSPGFISLVTVVETVWVLRRSFRISDAAIAAILEQIIEVDNLIVQNEREVFAAMVALRTGEASFDDALIGALGAWAGCSTTLTFDRKASRLKDFQLA
jgi:predicted nucleic-acid-binding protein